MSIVNVLIVFSIFQVLIVNIYALLSILKVLVVEVYGLLAQYVQGVI